MATFYLLPPRPLLADRFAESIKSLFPGIAAGRLQGALLAEMLAGAVTADGDVFVVHREDLPDREDPLAALAYCYGAEAGDEVVEVHAGPGPGEWTSRRWTLKRGASKAA
jgi:hypothetical protein